MISKNQIAIIRKRVLYFIISLLATLLITRILLFVSPAVNIYVFEYNIHHIYVGAIILILVSMVTLFDITASFLFIFSGIGSAFIIDELVYLIATDGSDLSYLSNFSLVGAIFFTVVVLIILGGLYYYAKYYYAKKENNGGCSRNGHEKDLSWSGSCRI